LKDCSIEEIIVGALYGKGVIYSAFLNDKEKAAASFQELIKSYPDHPRANAIALEICCIFDIDNFVINAPIRDFGIVCI